MTVRGKGLGKVTFPPRQFIISTPDGLASSQKSDARTCVEAILTRSRSIQASFNTQRSQPRPRDEHVRLARLLRRASPRGARRGSRADPTSSSRHRDARSRVPRRRRRGIHAPSHRTGDWTRLARVDRDAERRRDAPRVRGRGGRRDRHSRMGLQDVQTHRAGRVRRG